MPSDRILRPRGLPPAAAPDGLAAADEPPVRHPRPGGKLRLPRSQPLRPAMLSAFLRVLTAARRAAAGSAADPVAAVHEYRKSLRRARAVIALLAPSLGKRAAKGFVRRLQSAFRVTGALRDADVLLATLRAVPLAAEEDPARHALEAALELEQGRTRGETSEILARGLRSLTALPGALEVTLDPGFSSSDLEQGLARGRRRERRAFERARQSGSDEDLHAWRKRVKELRYQIELLASAGSRDLKKREKTLGELAQELGGVTDLILLSREIVRREGEGRIPAVAALRDRIQQLVRARSPKLLERGGTLFEESPRLFARRVMAERG